MSDQNNDDVPPTQQLEHFLSYDPIKTEVKLRHRVGPNVLARIQQISAEVTAKYPQLPFEILYRKSTIGGYHHIKGTGHATAVNAVIDSALAEGWTPEKSVNILSRIYSREFDKSETPAEVGKTKNMWSTHSPQVNLKQTPMGPIYSQFPTAELAAEYRRGRGIPYGEKEAQTAAQIVSLSKNWDIPTIEPNVTTEEGRRQHANARRFNKQQAINFTRELAKIGAGRRRNTRRRRHVTRKTRRNK